MAELRVRCVHTTAFYKSELCGSRAVPEATMTTLEFIAALYVALCVGATIGYVIAALLINASER